MSAPRYQQCRDGESWAVRDSLTGFMVLTQESYTVASNVCDYLNRPDSWDSSECCDVAQRILQARVPQ